MTPNKKKIEAALKQALTEKKSYMTNEATIRFVVPGDNDEESRKNAMQAMVDLQEGDVVEVEIRKIYGHGGVSPISGRAYARVPARKKVK